MPGDRPRDLLGTAGVAPADRIRKGDDEALVFVGPNLGGALLLGGSSVGISQAFGLGAVECRLLDEQPLPLVPATRGAPADDDR